MSFEDLRAFLAVVERGSFFAAATALGVSRTTLRRQVDALEARAGVLLLHRNRNGVSLTEAGRQLVRSGRVMEQEFAALLRAIRETGQKPAGQVRVLLPVGLPPDAMAMLLGVARRSWPAVHVVMRFSEAPLAADLPEVDVVLWFGGGDPGRGWDTRTVLPVRRRLMASRAYLAERGAHRTVADLAAHDLLAWLAPGEAEASLVTTAGDRVPVQAVLATANVHLLHECAHRGLGIAWAPDAGLPPGPTRESLVPVLADDIGCDIALRLSVPRPLAETPKVRVILDNLEAMLALATSPEPQ